VTFVADFDVRAADRGPRFNDIAAGTGEFYVCVLGMDLFFHGCLSEKTPYNCTLQSKKIPHCRINGQGGADGKDFLPGHEEIHVIL
jgi:hypothetical protein